MEGETLIQLVDKGGRERDPWIECLKAVWNLLLFEGKHSL